MTGEKMYLPGIKDISLWKPLAFPRDHDAARELTGNAPDCLRETGPQYAVNSFGFIALCPPPSPASRVDGTYVFIWKIL